MPWHDVLKRRYLFYQNGKYFILASPSTCGFNVFVTATCYEPKLLYFGRGPLTTQCTWPQVLHAPWRARILARPRLCHPRARERGPSPGSRLKFNQILWDRISPSCDRVQCSLTLEKGTCPGRGHFNCAVAYSAFKAILLYKSNIDVFCMSLFTAWHSKSGVTSLGSGSP